jgi:hypothetical protein
VELAAGKWRNAVGRVLDKTGDLYCVVSQRDIAALLRRAQSARPRALKPLKNKLLSLPTSGYYRYTATVQEMRVKIFQALLCLKVVGHIRGSGLG